MFIEMLKQLIIFKIKNDTILQKVLFPESVRKLVSV